MHNPRPMKISVALVLVICGMSAAFAGDLPKGTVVRIEGSGIEGGWHEGKITVTGEGCTMVSLAKPTKDGYTLIALIATTRLQKQQGASWLDVSVKDLRAHEPQKCLEEGAD
jgi:hypothetical protein